MAPLYLLLHFKTYFKFHFLPFLDPSSDKKSLDSPSQRVLPCTAYIFYFHQLFFPHPPPQTHTGTGSSYPSAGTATGPLGQRRRAPVHRPGSEALGNISLRGRLHQPRRAGGVCVGRGCAQVSRGPRGSSLFHLLKPPHQDGGGKANHTG